MMNIFYSNMKYSGERVEVGARERRRRVDEDYARARRHGHEEEHNQATGTTERSYPIYNLKDHTQQQEPSATCKNQQQTASSQGFKRPNTDGFLSKVPLFPKEEDGILLGCYLFLSEVAF